MRRRAFLGWTMLAPLAAGCDGDVLPEGVARVRWDRDVCARCGMLISDYRFAAQARRAPHEENLKYDDIGCALVHLRERALDPATRVWVTDATSRQGAVAWLDARRARYLPGRSSPMGYDFAAMDEAREGGVDFGALRRAVLAQGAKR